jgi:hypothetical protein
MRPSDEGVEEFRRLYNKLAGQDIDIDAAREIATRVLTLYELLTTPLSGEAETVSARNQELPPL